MFFNNGSEPAEPEINRTWILLHHVILTNWYLNIIKQIPVLLYFIYLSNVIKLYYFLIL